MAAVEPVPASFPPGKLHKRPPPVAVRFASSTRCTTPASRSSASLPHYVSTRSRSRSRARSTSRTRSDSSDSDSGEGYETAAETPPMSSSPEPFRGRPTSPARSRTPESSNGPATPVQLHPTSSIPLASVTSADILHALHANATSPVPFPYRLQWPELPPSPPLTPDVLDTGSSDVERPTSGVMPLRAKYEQKEGRWKRSTWTHPPATFAPVPRKLSNMAAWTHPSPSFEIPPSPESARVIPIPQAATVRTSGDLPDAIQDSPQHEAPARKAHSRSHSEPVNVPTLTVAPEDISKPAATTQSHAKHVPRKLHKKKRVSAPPATAAMSVTSATPASTLVGASEKWPKRVSALSLFGAHHSHKDKAASLLTPPETPTALQVVVTTPTPPAAADEKKTESPQEPTPRQRSRHGRFSSLFGVPLNAPITLPKVPETAAPRRAKSLWRDESARRYLRTTARDGERENLKLWPVANTSTLSVPLVSAPRGPDGLGMGWGRASTLSLTLVMGSGSAARTTRRLRKAGGVSRQRNAQEDTVGSLGGRLARVWSGRKRTSSSSSVEQNAPGPASTAPVHFDTSDDESEYNDAEDVDVDVETNDSGTAAAIDSGAHTGSARRDLMQELDPDPVFDVVRALRRQSADGLTSSTASTNSAASGSLLFRPLRTKPGGLRASSPSPSFALDRVAANADRDTTRGEH